MEASSHPGKHERTHKLKFDFGLIVVEVKYSCIPMSCFTLITYKIGKLENER